MNLKTTVVALVAMGGLAIITAPAVSAKEQDKIVTVKAGDTLSKIAKDHETTYVKLFNANKDIANPDVIDVGDKIRIPAKKEKLPNRFDALVATPATPAATATTNTTAVTNVVNNNARVKTPSRTYASSAGNTYGWGQCTWYAKNRRPDLPNMLGNGGSWRANAAARGIATGSTPRAGAIAEIPGHVMYVEKVNGNGTINISEMNYNGGVGVVNRRTISTGSVSGYIY